LGEQLIRFNTRKLNVSFWFLSVLLVQLVLIFQTIFKVLPVTIGFFPYWSKLSETSTVYKDFFYPFPPISLIIDGAIPRLFPNIAVAEQTLQAIKWLLIVSLLFFILRKLDFSPLSAFIGVTIAATGYYVSPGNITAGYLELVWLFLLAATFFALCGFKSNKKSEYFLLVSGLFLSFASLTKQTAIVPSIAVLATIVLIEIVKPSKSSMKQAGLLLLGFALPIVFFMFVGLLQGNLHEALLNIFSGGGKNPFSSDKWIYWLLDGLGIKSPKIPLLLIAGGLLLLVLRKKIEITASVNYLLAGTSLTLLQLGILGFSGLDPIQGIVQGKMVSWLIFFFIVLASFAFVFDYFDLQIKRKVIFGVLPLFACIVIIIGTKIPSFDGDLSLWVFNYPTYLNQVGGLTTIALFFLAISQIDKFNKGYSKEFKNFTLLFAVSFGFAAMNSLSAGLGIETWLLTIALAVSYFSKVIEENLRSKLALIPILISVLLIILPMSIAQSIRPYEWWGIAEDSLDSVHKDVNLPGFEGFILGENTAKQYSQIALALQSNEQGEAVLLGPNLAGLLGEVFDNVNQVNLECPILWWDLCPETMAQADLNALIKNPPNLIVWNVAPEFVIHGHETNFLNGKKSAQRSIQQWVKQQAKSGDYRIVLDTRDEKEGWGLLVLKKN
jgi:hypothetical protein